jgi:hypothetical protein
MSTNSVCTVLAVKYETRSSRARSPSGLSSYTKYAALGDVIISKFRYSSILSRSAARKRGRFEYAGAA